MLPPFLNRITESSGFDRIRKKKEHIVKVIMSKQLASLIKLISRTYLKKDIEIHHSELVPLFNDYSKTLYYSIDIIKNLAVIIVAIYVKKYSTSFYYTMLKYIYNYKTGVELESFNDRLAKIKLTNIIEERRWGELFNPNVYKAIIHLYQMNTDESNIISELVHTFYYTIAKMFASWSVSSFFKHVLIGPTMSLFMVFYRNDGDVVRKIGVIVSAGIIGYFTQNFFLTNVVCHFGYYLVFSRLVMTILRFFRDESVKKFHELNTINANYIVPTVISTVFVAALRLFFSPTVMIIMLMEIVRNIIIDRDYRRTIIHCTLLGTGFLSSFHPLHIIHNALVIYVLLGVIDDNTFRILSMEFKRLIFGWYRDISNERIQLADEVRRIYKQISEMVKNRINGQPDLQKVRFEMMDIEMFPSVSQKIGCVSKTTKDDIIKINNPINDQPIIKKISSNMMEIDARLFTLRDHDFIDAISVESDDKFLDSILIKSIKEPEPDNDDNDDNDDNGEVEIIEDFCTSK